VESCDRNKDGEIDYMEFLESMKLNWCVMIFFTITFRYFFIDF
jgi:hypothetical protein